MFIFICGSLRKLSSKVVSSKWFDTKGLQNKVQVFRNTNMNLDEFLNWDFQIEHISNKIASSIFNLSQIRNILPVNICLLVLSLLVVRPHIEYGIVTWGGVKNFKLEKIRSLQKRQSERLIIVLSRHIQIH